MKKALAVVLLIILVMCGCGKKNDIELKTKNISFVAEVSYYNESYSFKTKIDAKGNMSATVIKPDSFKDLTFDFSKGKTTAEFMGISYVPQNGKLPANNAAKVIYEAMIDVSSNKDVDEKDGKNFVAEGKIDNRKYVFVFSPAGFPLSLELTDEGYKAVFNNLTVE